MRRVELLIDQIRRFTENESPTTTSGIKDEDLVELLNRAQDRLYNRLFAETPSDFIAQETIDTTASTEAYTLSSGYHLDNKIISVEYKYDDSNDYLRLAPMSLHSRYTDNEGNPQYYILKNNTILLNPIPDESKTDGLRVNYYVTNRDVDKRRGYVKTATKTGSVLDSLTLEDPSSLNTKDADLDDAAEDVLQEIDYICIVDKDGATVIDGIPILDYNTSTRVITVDSHTTSVAAATMQDNYVVGGKYATSHSEFPDNYERYLMLYAEHAILLRDGNDVEAGQIARKLATIENDIMTAASKETDTPETPLDEDWWFV